MALRRRLLTATVAALAVTAVSAATIVSANAATSPDKETRPSTAAQTTEPTFATGSRVDLGAGRTASINDSSCYLNVTELAPAIPAGSGWNGMAAVNCHGLVASNISLAAVVFTNGVERPESFYGGDVPDTDFAYVWTPAVQCGSGANQLVASATVTWAGGVQEFLGIKYGPPSFCG